MKQVCLFIKDLRGGGAEKVAVNLAKGLNNKGWKVDLLLMKKEGPYLQLVPAGVNIVEIGSKKAWFVLPRLIRYLKSKDISIFISFLPYANLFSLIVKMIEKRETHFIITEHLSLLNIREAQNPLRNLILKWPAYLLTRSYALADNIVTVSRGMAAELKQRFPSKSNNIHVIYNPIVSSEIIDQGREPLENFWFDLSSPLIIGIGSLNYRKDFATLLYAFAQLRVKKEVKLVILGEGLLRNELVSLAAHLNISDSVLFTGFVSNPYKYLLHASLLVVSSRCESFANVLVEALAFGVPVVSTDCPYGPKEILEGGKHGMLVTVGDSDEMARAMETVLNNPPEKSCSIKRAQDFSIDKISQEYIELFHKIQLNK